MKLLCLSDLHGHLPEDLPPADVTVLAGDYMPDQDYQQEWCDYTMKPWLDRLSRQTTVIGVGGNHDRLFEEQPEYAKSLNWIYLQDSGATVQGIEFWGIPWTYQIFPMAFAARREFLQEVYAKIPRNVDVLISHGPPRDAGDLCMNGERLGCEHLANRIRGLTPRLVVCGHIHSGFGIFNLESTIVVNASVVNEQRQLVRGPVEVELAGQ